MATNEPASNATQPSAALSTPSRLLTVAHAKESGAGVKHKGPGTSGGRDGSELYFFPISSSHVIGSGLGCDGFGLEACAHTLTSLLGGSCFLLFMVWTCIVYRAVGSI